MMFTFLMHRQKHCFLYTTIYNFSSNLLLATFYNRLHLNCMCRNYEKYWHLNYTVFIECLKKENIK